MNIPQWFCKHDYQEVCKVKVEYFLLDTNDVDNTSMVFLYKCSKCGKFKKIKI